MILTFWQDPLVVNVYLLVSTAQLMLLLAPVVFLLGFYKDPLVVNVNHLVSTAQQMLLLAPVVLMLTI